MNSNILDILLKNDLPKTEIKEYKVKRLSECWGEDVIFQLKPIGYNRVAELRMIENGDVAIHILLAGLVAPDFKSKELQMKLGVVTPADGVKKLLLPGEIEEMSRVVENLSGYRKSSLEEVKKK